MNSHLETSLSLLKRLKQQPADQQAWEDLVERYGSRILLWCRRWGLQDADAADVTQAVLLKLAKGIQRFNKDSGGSFRAWLKTLAHHAWYDLVSSRQHKLAAGSTDLATALESLDAKDELAQCLETEWEQELIQLASVRIKKRVDEKTWQAFKLMTTESLSAQEVSSQLGINLTSAYKAKSNVLKMLKEEVARLEASEFA